MVVKKSETIAFLERRSRERDRRIQWRLAEAQSAFERIVAMIIADHHPLRVWQWGSLLHTRRFSEVSDIDIAVEGLEDAHAIFEIYEKAEEMTTLPLDIVELGKIEPEFAALIRTNGVLIHERT